MTRKWLGVLLLLLVATSASAENAAGEALDTVAETNRADAASQNRIDELSEATLEMLKKYRRAVTQYQQLKVYNNELEKIVAKQEQRKAALQEQISSIKKLRAKIEPLMLRMIDHLAKFVKADLPFLLHKRRQRVASLRAAVANPDLSVAQRFRKVLSAYQQEAEYGRTIGTYRGELELDGKQRFVAFLRVGRVMLFYITPDNSRVGYWDREQETWRALPDGYAEAVRQGVRVAKDLVASRLLKLPVPAPDSISGGPAKPSDDREGESRAGHGDQAPGARGGKAS